MNVAITSKVTQKRKNKQGYQLYEAGYLSAPSFSDVLATQIALGYPATKFGKPKHIYTHYKEGIHITKWGSSLSSIEEAEEAEVSKVDAALYNHIAKELEKTQQELDKFAYVASHDLKAPLRAVANLADWIGEDLEGGIITKDTLAHLGLLKSRIVRLETLLDDLLLYAKIGARDEAPENVKILELIRNITEMLPTEKFNVVTETDTTILCVEKFKLELVLRNLISNSIKHHHKKSGTITIDVVDRDNYTEFTVSDDGPGIKPERWDEAFEMFKTFKPRDEVEGSGIGLALIKKIVEDSGHTVEILRSKKGLSVRFTWPNYVLGSEAEHV